MEKLAAILADEVHFFFATSGTRIAVLQFVIFCRTDNLDHPRFFEPREVSINGAQGDFGKAQGDFRRLENPVGVFDHIVKNLLTCLSFIFHDLPIIARIPRCEPQFAFRSQF